MDRPSLANRLIQGGQPDWDSSIRRVKPSPFALQYPYYGCNNTTHTHLLSYWVSITKESLFHIGTEHSHPGSACVFLLREECTTGSLQLVCRERVSSYPGDLGICILTAHDQLQV